MKSILIPLLVSAIFLTLSQSAVAQAAKSKARPAGAVLSKEDDQGIRKTVMDFETAWNTHDMKLLATLFLEDAEFINVVGMHWHGRDAIVSATAAFHETMFKNNRMRFDAIETRALGPDYAIAVATLTLDSFTTPSGEVVPEAQNRETFLLMKGSEGWKIAHGHNVRVDAEAAKHDPVNSAAK